MWVPAWSLLDTIVVAIFLPLAILILTLRGGFFSEHNLRKVHDLLTLRCIHRTHSPFSLQRAARGYNSYPHIASVELSRMRGVYAQLGRAHKRIAYNLGYAQKLDRLQEVTDANSRITRAISRLARSELGVGQDAFVGVEAGDIGRTRESLKHFVRDWSTEGRSERDRIFTPILDVLRRVDSDKRSASKVLVPGSGLGRLAWEISQLGFDTTANEISFFMTLALRFLLSSSTTTQLNQHVVHPYAHWFSHQRKNDALFRGITFPDVIPRLSSNFHLLERDFLSLPTTSLQRYEYIATLFFIDTSVNVISTIECIFRLLRPGGVWINLGPLLWIGGAQACPELSLEELLILVEDVGFVLEPPNEGDILGRRSVECEYTADKEAMMKWIYEAEFWVAKRPK